MEYLQFVYAVKDAMEETMCETMSVAVHTVVKNNGRERVGVTISEDGHNLSPTIYLEEFYEQYEDGDDVRDVATRILTIYQEVKIEKKWDVEFLKSYETVKDKLAYKLIHAKQNELLLKELPHRMYLDLAKVCYILVDVDAVGTATILVTNEMLKLWGVDKETVLKDAEENAEEMLSATFQSMSEMIRNMYQGLELPEECENMLYVLTNENNHFGAACMLYEGMLKQIGETLGENFYIIPCSIHEVLIVPESVEMEWTKLEEMIQEVNELAVEPEEVLSNVPYYYIRSADRLIL